MVSSFAFSKKVAGRYLWSRRSEAFITIITYISILGVAIGVAVLTIVMAVMTGFEYELKQKIVGTDSHITVKSIRSKIEPWSEVSAAISALPGVSSVSPYTQSQALLRSRGSASGLIVRGIAPDTAGSAQLGKMLAEPSGLADLFNPAAVETENEEGQKEEVRLPGIIVGRDLARSLGLLVGSTVSLLSPNVTSTPFGLVPKYRRFVIAGVYSSGLVEYENGMAYIALSEAQQFFRLGQAVSGLEVRVSNIDNSRNVTRAIVDATAGLNAGLYAEDWTERNKPLWEALRLEKRVYFIVLLLIIVMASFSIVSTLIMIVLEKRKDIGVMRTLGASTRSIADIFRIQGAVIGGIGTLSGILLGLGGCFALKTYGFPLDEKVFQMSTLPIKVDLLNVLAVGFAAFLICYLATRYPARRASRLHPSDVLRYE